ncbi:MAG: YdbH domain-containing protein [Pseudomonadota bacterium]
MPRYRKTLYIILCLLIFFTGYISITYFYKFILNYVESKLLPETAKEIGIDNLRFKIQKAGLFGADIAYISTGRDNIDSPSIDSLHIEYDPIGLYKKYIKKVVINGVRIECEFNNGKFNIRGFDWQNFIRALQSKKSTPSENIKSFPVESIELRNSTISAHLKNQNIDIPIDLKIVPHNINKSLIDCLLNLYPRDTHIKIASKINLDTNQAEIFFGTKQISFERFSDFSSFIPDTTISGSADIDGKMQIKLSPFKISSMSCSTSAYNLSASYNNINLINSIDEISGKKMPVIFDIRNSGDNKWIFSATTFLVNSPFTMNISGIKCNIVKSEDMVNASGNFYALAGGKTPVRIKSDYYLSLSNKGKWNFKISGASIKGRNASQIPINIKGLDILSNNLNFVVSGKGNDKKSYLKYLASISGLGASNKRLSLKTPKISLSGNADIVKSNVRGSLNINSDNTIITTDSLKTTIPAFSISGNFKKDLKTDLQCNGKIQFNDVNITDQKLQVNISGIGGILPFKWPFVDTKSEGTVFAKTILWKNIDLGSFSGSVRQNNSGLIYKGRYTNIPFKGMNLDFSGYTDLLSPNSYETEISINMHKYKLSSGSDINRLFPQAKGLSFGGEAQLNGKLRFKENKFTGFIKANIEEGLFNYKDKGILIEGIKINLNLPNLPSVSSAPKQQLAFGKASIGSIQLSDGKLDFQIESAESFFIEKCRFKWCDGSVNTNSLRISSLNKDLSLILFCDRINLAKLIEQFGVAKAEGIGAVNGTIPIEYSDGKLIFADGFLYSTPGDGGIIHLAEAKILAQNLIPGTNQFAQIELTIEALKNYKYDWAKLKFSSAEENLLLNLQFDGKPVNTLPFIYDKKTGGFVRVKSAEEGSNFQGIRLDINLTIPLDKVLYYKDAINKNR